MAVPVTLKSLDHYSDAQAHGMIEAVSLSVPQHLSWKTQNIQCLVNEDTIQEQEVVIQTK